MLVEVGDMGWLIEQTETWRRGLCGRRVMRDAFGHVCVPTPAQRVCSSGDTGQRCWRKMEIGSRSGPAQRDLWGVLNENRRE